MSENIEIEYKVLLTKNLFNKLETEMPFPREAIVQVNHYFDTKNFLLKKFRCSLRIREIDEQYTLTLKQPMDQNILETNDILTKEEFHAWMYGNPIPKSHTSKKLRRLGVAESDLSYFGALKTERKEFSSEKTAYCLDKSIYNGVTDYELEIEAPTIEIGKSIFNNLLEKYNIPKKDPITKIERFFRTLPRDKEPNQLPFK